jgi:hypothetical protein
MPDMQPMDESELISEGLHNYWDARFAMRVFEDAIQEAARLALKANLAKIGKACGVEQVQEKDIWPNFLEPECRLGQVAICAGYAWESGIRLGVGWRSPGDNETLQSAAILTIRTAALFKYDKIFRALKDASVKIDKGKIFLEGRREWPVEVAIWSPLDYDANIPKIKTTLNAILDSTIEWSLAVGNLRIALYGDIPSQAADPGRQPEAG